MIINLSCKLFSVYDFKLLNKGLNFCPTPGIYNSRDFDNDFKDFARKIKLKAHFGPQSNTNEEIKDGFKPETDKTWEPLYTHHTVKTFLEALEKDVNEVQPLTNNVTRCNLSKNERLSLERLKKMDDIIITKADKGGATVILDIEDYIKEAERQLHDTDTYETLEGDPTLMYNDIINNAIDKLKNENELTSKLALSLKTNKPKTPKFYTLPKIHKENNPGRPVVNSIESHTSKISKYVDFYLQPIAQHLPSYIKDTSHFLRKLNTTKEINPRSILVTLDVKSLYTNIPNEEGISAVKNAIARSTDSKISSKVITTFLWLILTLSNFVFNGINYLQKLGVTMGSICSPSYANIFMGDFEFKYIYPLIRSKCKLYTRFIDDIFMIWNGTEKELHDFFKTINSVHPTIKFDTKWSFKEINFLDTVVYKDQKCNLQTKIYRKATDRTSLLHNKSAHPSATKSSIIYSQALRIKRICSEEHVMRQQFLVLKEKLIARGYAKEVIDQNIAKTDSITREELLIEKEKSATNPKLPFVTTFNKNLPNIREKIDSNWNTLKINPKIGKAFQEKPLVAFRRNRNLQDLIGGNTILDNKVVRKNPTKGSSSPCNRGHGSKYCSHVKQTTSFKSTKTNRSYSIREKINCKMTWLLYLCTCKKCSIQYVGKTEWPFNQRLNKHRFDVLVPDSPQVDQHFNQPNHDFDRDAQFTLIEKLTNLEGDKETKRKRIKSRENFWIKELKTLHPDGLNEYINRI